MASAEGMVMASGALAFAGSFKEAGGFPSNGYSVIAGTAMLTFLASLTRNSPISQPVKALAVLMLLAAAIRYIPGLAKTSNTRGKRNG